MDMDGIGTFIPNTGNTKLVKLKWKYYVIYEMLVFKEIQMYPLWMIICVFNFLYSVKIFFSFVNFEI